MKSRTRLRASTGGFPIVGVGASAGGLEAFQSFLSSIPTDTGMAFVLVQHLDPKHDSMSTEILTRATKMPVAEVVEGTRVEPNHVYMIPPNVSLEIVAGKLNLQPRSEAPGLHLVIDLFLQSLARDVTHRSIGIVLSGTGADGTQGLKAIKEAGGITFAQTPASAKFDGMPSSAIASGSVDLVLSPTEIAKELARLSRHPYLEPASEAKADDAIKAKDDATDETLPDHVAERKVVPESLKQIFQLLRRECHVDFSLYKANTVQRRIERRMVLKQVDTVKSYAEILAKDPEEVRALYADILIHVTSFFRDPEAFLALKKDVFPGVLENRASGKPIRIWVPGCSTGEEAYSLAISLLEFLGDKASHVPIQIFATDISEQAVQKCRIGEYPESIREHVSAERLSRFFLRLEGGGFKISKAIRDICLFSRHDVTIDPPFAKIDLISCRNLLIYFATALQKHVIPIFHYSLRRQGFLWLGRSETIGGFSDLFLLVNKTNKVYARKDAPVATSLRFPASTYVHPKSEALAGRKAFKKIAVDVEAIAEKAVQDEYPGVLVNENMEILQLRGRTAPYLEPVAGIPSYNLLKMAHPELSRDLRMTIQAARKANHSVRKFGLSIKQGRGHKLFNLNVVPVKSEDAETKMYLILFEPLIDQASGKSKKLTAAQKAKLKTAAKKDPQFLELQQELNESLDYQHSLVEKFETVQEDLTTANEELQSTNEELQSTNEELETAKEELQSGNEELTTVNDELQTRNVEQIQTNNDLINLLGSVEIPIVMLSLDKKVRRFTPLAAKVLNLISTDVGRPFTDLRLNFKAPGIDSSVEKMVTEAIQSMTSSELEVQDSKNCWFRLQVRPYKTVENKIDGAVLTFVDINNLKLSLREVKDARGEAERANRAKDLFLATLSHELRTPLSAILSWSQMIGTGKLSIEEIRRAAGIVEESAKIQAELINDLLDVSRIIAGKLLLESKELDPADMIMSAIEAIRHAAEKKSIQIEMDLAPNVGTVAADPVRLQQVFWNLLSNAVKFSAPGSKVTVKLQRVIEGDGEKAQAMIQVSDSGKGISADFLPQIFNSFSQEDSSSIRVHGGLGLGLAIVRNLVELHGGTVQAESLGDQAGATFTVMLPIVSDRSSTEIRKAQKSSKTLMAEQVDPHRLRGIRVLIVDDESSTRDAVGAMLRSFGAEIRIASSAKEGLECFGNFKPQFLISDIAMPGEDGYSFIQKIRKQEAGQPPLPALALTAYAGADDIRRALTAGFQAHLAKPVDGQLLASTMLNILEKSNLVWG